ncbi:sigma-54 dependent transcriptional regulator [Lacimicrobium alkaliphilum]|uniref:Sigma-54-dependent Fis family transcriptional regulator n=1 Tax=Lacimicrobium alkaliphilum TaxID=1526571 RepID=A0ABQ1RK80_9ALTE|nr:sigma-54 dependent transcriptional regulator [Lacimicrobium alkaliphilum]GGD72581.1 sigma-54-dependent Fis family transcriptional regulator [Lacimicrobium alkaliphilum]
MSKILIISEPEARRISLQTILTFMGEQPEEVAPLQAEAHLQQNHLYSAILIDAEAGSMIEALTKAYPYLPFVLVGQSTMPCTNNQVGVVSEPVTYPQLTQMLHRCQAYLSRKPDSGSSVHNKTKLFRSLIGKSAGIQAVRHMIEQVAPTDANVLVLGESGTGKEVVARNVHYLSNRKSGPFIPVNCGAIPGELLESELFGHEKGAFTGAVSSRKGRFELAESGTLFLDEIGDMPLQMQVKLLRVLQERTYERVGGVKPIPCNVRVIAATHRDLETMIQEGNFREDLYYRLNVFPIDSPPLRERKDDIPLLLQELVSRAENETGNTVKFTQPSLQSLMEHPWAGNVRELSNLVERLLILHPNRVVDVSDLPPKYQHLDTEVYEPDYPEELLEREAINALFGSDDDPDSTSEGDNSPVTGEGHALPEDGLNLKEYLADLEVNLISQALQQQDWVVARAAEVLGMRRTTLVEKMRKYGLSKE